MKFKKDDVWLCQFAGRLQPMTIIDVCGSFVRTEFSWEHYEIFKGSAKVKLGTVRRILGLRVGIKRDS